MLTQTQNLAALKNLIQNDIIGSIEDNLRSGNITVSDAQKLKRLTHLLYQQIYSHYQEMEELNEMTDESLMLDIDIIEKEHEMQLAAKNQELAAKDSIIEKKQSEISALKERIRQLENTTTNTP